MGWGKWAMLALTAVIALSFAQQNISEDEYYHYCYRTCCLNADAAYVEGPPQECIGAGPDFSENLERCRELCVLEMNITGGVIGEGEMIEYVDRGVVYEPEEDYAGNGSSEISVGNGSQDGSGNATVAASAPDGAVPAGNESGLEHDEGVEGETDAEGGVCAGAFVLLVALLVVVR